MPPTWFEPLFPINLILDLTNYLIVSFLFIFLYQLKLIKKKFLYLSLIFLLTPFLFNGFLFDWHYIPDQSKYLGEASFFRKNPQEIQGIFYSYKNLKIEIPSIIYAFSPIFSLETYKGISLWNRAIFLFSWVFFTQKKFINDHNSFLMLIAPSLIFFSSVALRENLIIILMFWFIYFFYKKNKLGIIATILFVLLIKFQLIFTLILFIVLNYLIMENKIRVKIIFLILISLFGTALFFNEEVLEIINYYRSGFFLEQFGEYKSNSARTNYSFYEIGINLKSVGLIINNFFFFITPSFLKGNFSLFTFIIFIELIAILFYLFVSIKYLKKNNLNIIFKWITILLLSYLFYSLFIFNDGTIYRYKVPIFFFVLFGFFANMKALKTK